MARMPIRELSNGRSINLPDLETSLEHGSDLEACINDDTISDTLIHDADIAGLKLGPLTLSNVVLRQVDLSNASLQRLVVRRGLWRTCRAMGLRLSIELASDLSIEDCRFDYANIGLQKVKGIAVFSSCTFREATLSGDLSNIVFLDCDFIDTEFRATRATNCDLRTSRLTSARGLLTLRGATISTDQAVAISALLATEAGLVVADS
jgi:uncharacterized protein YjbI with pentapeptide repeats